MRACVRDCCLCAQVGTVAMFVLNVCFVIVVNEIVDNGRTDFDSVS